MLPSGKPYTRRVPQFPTMLRGAVSRYTAVLSAFVMLLELSSRSTVDRDDPSRAGWLFLGTVRGLGLCMGWALVGNRVLFKFWSG